MKKNMIKHKFNIFPDIISDDYERLKNDIAVNGYDNKQPIYIYQNAIIDGWNRQRVCDELKITPVYKQFEGSDTDAINFVMRTNKRRNLTSSQWATIAIEAGELIEIIKSNVENSRREKLIGNKNAGTEKQPVEQIPQVVLKPQRTTEILAKTFNTNSKYIDAAQRLKRDHPAIFEQVKSGEKTITEVKKEEKIESSKQNIINITKKIETENLIVTDKYDVLVIDPPWAYGREYDPETSRAANPYPEMETDKISEIELPIKDDAVIFLWTTHAFIQDAFWLLDKWGLNYKAIITWDKEQMGLGATIRMQCEFCLLATKGKPIIQGKSERDIIREQRREHSRKPESFYSMVERMTIGKRLDYFARTKRENWSTFGTMEND